MEELGLWEPLRWHMPADEREDSQGGKKREGEREREQGSKEKARKGKERGQMYIKEERGTVEDKRQRKEEEKCKREAGYIRGGGAGGRAGIMGTTKMAHAS